MTHQPWNASPSWRQRCKHCGQFINKRDPVTKVGNDFICVQCVRDGHAAAVEAGYMPVSGYVRDYSR